MLAVGLAARALAGIEGREQALPLGPVRLRPERVEHGVDHAGADHHTGTIQAAHFFDSLGNLMTGVTITSQSGLPEPSS